MAGTWRLDRAASQIADGAGLAGLIGAGVPPTLHVTHAANGTIVVEAPINEGHARLYQPGRQTSTPVAQGGTIAMTTKWSGTTLVADGTMTGANVAAVTVRESYAVNATRTILVRRRQRHRRRWCAEGESVEVRADHRHGPVREMADAV